MECRLGGSRGKLIHESLRKTALTLINEAVEAGASLVLACAEVGICRRTHDRWRGQVRLQGSCLDRRTLQKSPLIACQRRLTDEEREEVLRTCNSERFASKPPSQIVPILAEEGIYLCSEATMYRILKEAKQGEKRGRARRLNQPSKPSEVKVTAAGQCYSWDITFLPSLVRGHFFKLYMILDLFSRKVVGWEVHDRECGKYAADLLNKTRLNEGIDARQLTLHSDNGAAMKSESMLAMMDRLGVTKSFSRPSVSNDNPFSEAAFKTMKYVPNYPEKPFETIDCARKWVHSFVKWYNVEHRHSGIRFVTPNEKHSGLDADILSRRSQTYVNAQSTAPLRWSGKTRNWSPVTTVTLNPDANVLVNPVVEDLKAA